MRKLKVIVLFAVIGATSLATTQVFAEMTSLMQLKANRVAELKDAAAINQYTAEINRTAAISHGVVMRRKINMMNQHAMSAPKRFTPEFCPTCDPVHPDQAVFVGRDGQEFAE